METFSPAKPLAPDPGYARRRTETLAALELGAVDEPLRDLVVALNQLSCCFTLQCCHGHFVWAPGQDEHNLDRLPPDVAAPVRYRIAYVALCLEDGPAGRRLRGALERVTEIDPEYVQFGSAEWFWEQCPNSYVLQVEPAAQRCKDQAELGRAEALRTERVRDRFFTELRRLVAAEQGRDGP